MTKNSLPFLLNIKLLLFINNYFVTQINFLIRLTKINYNSNSRKFLAKAAPEFLK